MAIKLSLKSKIVPIKIENFDFELDLSDEKMIKFTEKRIDLLKRLESLKDSDEKEDKLTELLEDAFDDMLGTGAYTKLFHHCGSIHKMAFLLSELVKAIFDELNIQKATENV